MELAAPLPTGEHAHRLHPDLAPFAIEAHLDRLPGDIRGDDRPAPPSAPPTSANGGLPPTFCQLELAARRRRGAARGRRRSGRRRAAGVGRGGVCAGGGARRDSAARRGGGGARERSRDQRSYAPEPGACASAPGAINRSARRPRSADATATPRSAQDASQLQLSRLPKAIELFSEWAAMHGYSEPVKR